MPLKAWFYPDAPFETLMIPNIIREIYLEEIYRDVCALRRDMVILDIGANVGLVTHYLREHARKVYAIEPASENFAALQQNKEFNSWDNVEVFNLAIADEDGQMQLSLMDGNRTGHTLMVNEQTERGTLVDGGKFILTGKFHSAEMVPTRRLDTFFTEQSIEHVDFVKMDIEGAEDVVLRSEGFQAVASRIDAIEVEFHYPNWVELVRLLEGLGFTAQRYVSSAIVVLFYRPEVMG